MGLTSSSAGFSQTWITRPDPLADPRAKRALQLGNSLDVVLRTFADPPKWHYYCSACQLPFDMCMVVENKRCYERGFCELVYSLEPGPPDYRWKDGWTSDKASGFVYYEVDDE